jgi:hypothetical protein
VVSNVSLKLEFKKIGKDGVRVAYDNDIMIPYANPKKGQSVTFSLLIGYDLERDSERWPAPGSASKYDSHIPNKETLVKGLPRAILIVGRARHESGDVSHSRLVTFPTGHIPDWSHSHKLTTGSFLSKANVL